MTLITTRLTVAPDGTISSTAPLPAGEYTASIQVQDQSEPTLAAEPSDLDWLPVLDLGPWPEGLSLRREDIYGDDGR
jgi:hypothetical protein